MRTFLRKNHVLRILAAFLVVSTSITHADSLPNILARRFLNEDAGDIKIKAEQGDVTAQQRYAELLEGGHHYAEAARWYRKAAEAGLPESQYKLGILLIQGRPQMGKGRPKLDAQPGDAIKLLMQASTQDHGLAQLKLGQCYQSGDGVKSNRIEAYKWFCLAADHTIIARSYRDRLALSLSTVQIQEGKKRAEQFKNGSPPSTRATPREVRPRLSEPDLAKLIKLQGIIASTANPLALMQGKSFGSGESRSVTVNGQQVEITCLEVLSDSVLITIGDVDEPVWLKLQTNPGHDHQSQIPGSTVATSVVSHPD